MPITLFDTIADAGFRVRLVADVTDTLPTPDLLTRLLKDKIARTVREYERALDQTVSQEDTAHVS